MLLEPGEYATFKQIKDAGGTVKKGQKSQFIVFWKWLEVEDEETGEETKIPYLRFYNVFEINKQCEGLTSKRKVEVFEHDPIEEAEKIWSGFINPPQMSFESGKAFYVPKLDKISIPPLEDYRNPHEYYSTMFHEMVHSTGHISRLKRPGIEEIASFGSETYSKEVLLLLSKR